MFSRVFRTLAGIAPGAVAALVLMGCGQPGDVEPASSNEQTFEPAGASRDYQPGNQRISNRERQLDFLHRIREADPRFQTIQRALMNERNELGLVLNPNVQMDEIPQLMRSMLVQMNKEFPGQDLTIVAYAPANPPMEIGTARLDAQSREMTFTRTEAPQSQRRFDY